MNTLKIIDPLEQDITDFLATEIDLLNNVEPTKRLSDLKKLYDEAVDRFIVLNFKYFYFSLRILTNFNILLLFQATLVLKAQKNL